MLYFTNNSSIIILKSSLKHNILVFTNLVKFRCTSKFQPFPHQVEVTTTSCQQNVIVSLYYITCDPNLKCLFFFVSFEGEGGRTKNSEKCRTHFYYNLFKIRKAKPYLQRPFICEHFMSTLSCLTFQHDFNIPKWESQFQMNDRIEKKKKVFYIKKLRVYVVIGSISPPRTL